MARDSVPDKRLLHRRDTWSNGSKEQMSLQPGSAEYKEYVRDKAGVQEEDFVQDDGVIDKNDERTSDEAQEAPPEPEHVAELAESLRRQAGRGQAVVDGTTRTKYRRRMSKEVQVGSVREAMVAAASETETKDDDEAAKRFSRRNSDDLPQIHDDGVSADEFLPRCFEKYM